MLLKEKKCSSIKIKKIIFPVLALSLASVIISGCGNKNETPLLYNATVVNSGVSVPISDERTQPHGYLFSSQKCVIPSDTNDTDENLTASSSMIVNQSKLSAVFTNNPYERLFPASTTKVLTAYIVLKHTDLNDIVTVSKEAANLTEEGIKLCGFKEGDKISVRDLLYSMLIYSGNDAATALGCYISGSEEEFAKLMNEEARLLGATDSHFTNANGLHNDNHYTTSYDLYLIFAECLKYDEFKKIINLSSYTVNYKNADDNDMSKTFDSTNKYLLGQTNAPDGITVIGGKTGTTSKAGNCLLLYSQDAKGKDYISVVLNASSKDSLYSQMTYLLSLIKQ